MSVDEQPLWSSDGDLEPIRKGQSAATLVLLTMAAAWGASLTVIKDLTERVPVLDLMAARFGVAAVVLVLIAPHAVPRLSRQSALRAVLLGLTFGGGQLLQVVGLAHTDASVSGFIAGLFVVTTPLSAALLLRHRLVPSTKIAVGVATVGLAVLGLRGFSVGAGELLTAIAAVLFGLHILGLSVWVRPGEAFGMSTLQVAVIGLVYLGAAAPAGLSAPAVAQDWWAILFLALGVTAGGLLAQTWAQGRLSATRSTLIMTPEPVFAAMFAIALGGEAVTARLLIGGSLLFGAILLTELGPRWSARSRPQEAHGSSAAARHSFGADGSGGRTGGCQRSPFRWTN